MRRRGLTPFVAGLIAIVVAIIGVYLGFTKKIPFRQHFEVKAAFQSSNNLKANSPVRIAGVEVGRVSKVEPMGKGADSAIVTMRIKDNGRPIHRDATAKIRPRIFLEGNFFVDLTAGSAGAPELDDGDIIPASQTATPVQLDEVLRALNAPTRKNLQLTLDELGVAFDKGGAKAFSKSLPDQAPAFKFTAIVTQALLGRAPHDLSNLERDFATTAKALDRSPAQLRSLLEDFNTFSRSLAVEQSNLRATVGELPRTLQAASPALDSLNASFPRARRLAREALPGVRSSRPAVAALRPLVSQLDGLVGADELRGLSQDLRGSTPALVRLSKRTPPLANQLRLFSNCLNEVVLPWSKDRVPDAAFPETGPVFQSAVKWLPGLSGESRSFDANGPWFKVLGSGGLETVELGQGVFGVPLFPLQGVNPPPTSRPPLKPDVPCETQVKPNLETVPQGPPATTKVDTSSSEFQDRFEAAKNTAIATLQDQFDAAGVELPIQSTLANVPLIDQLARRTGNTDQLRTLRSGQILNPRNIKRSGR